MRSLASRLRPAPASLRSFGLLVLLLLVIVGVSRGVSTTLVLDNVRQAAPLGVVVLGQALILMMGRLDLSVGAMASLANIVLCSVFAGDPGRWLPALAATLGCGILVGLVNGVMSTRLRIPSFLATLATSLVSAGLILVSTGGSPRGSVPAGFRVVTEGWLGGVLPWSGLVWLLAAGLAAALVHGTVLGRKMLIAGANPVSARHDGLPVDALVILSFVLTSLLATAGGILLSAITGMASIGVGNPFTLDSIAAAVVGGALFGGGVFRPGGAVAGTLILFFLQSLLYLLSLPPAGRFALQGGIIIVALALANIQRETRS